MRKQTTMAARELIQRARTILVLDQPFFGALALRLKLVEAHAIVNPDGSGKPLLAATDGTHLFYNPDFVQAITSKQLVFVLAHEVMHCAMGHMWRRDAREPYRFNVACDHAVNLILKASGFELFPWVFQDPQYEGQSAEWIYARLPEDLQDPNGGGGAKGQRGDGDGNNFGGGGSDVLDAPGAGEQAAEGTTEADWQQAVQQAATAAKQRGSLPSALERFVAEAVKPRVDWKSVLRRFVQQAAKADYTWTLPNRRYAARGLYLPALKTEAMGPIAIAVDTSGSIDDAVLSQFAAEMRAIAQELQPERVYVAYCDAAIGRVDTFERGEEIELHPVGGGGTSHRPVMDWLDDLDEPPVCAVCLTDLYTDHRPEPPAMPVLWATTHVAEVPYGEVLSLEDV